MKPVNGNVHFPGLNGLRFIAAFLVIFHHIEQVRFKMGLEHHWMDMNVREMGELGVTLFFVLSGFLITFLLLREKEKFENISLGKFYARRILRIWPLYYLVALLALFVLPQIEFLSIPGWTIETGNNIAAKTTLFLFILPNIANLLFTTVPFAGQLWSIGVEEQFYLIWPLILKFTRNYLAWMCGIIIFMVTLTNYFDYLCKNINGIPVTHYDRIISFWRGYLMQLRFSCMAIGGIAAWLVINQKEKILGLIFKRRIQLSAIAISVILVSLGLRIPFINHEFYSLLFAIIILNVAVNTKSIIKLQNWWLEYLGKISYGIYMYHYIAIVLVIKVLMHYFNVSVVTSNQYITLVAGSFGITLLFAILSYQFFEKPFLKLKDRFTRIKNEP